MLRRGRGSLHQVLAPLLLAMLVLGGRSSAYRHVSYNTRDPKLGVFELTRTAVIWRLAGHLLVILLRADAVRTGAVRAYPVRAGAVRLRGSSVLGQSAMARAHSLGRASYGIGNLLLLWLSLLVVDMLRRRMALIRVRLR